MPITGNDYPYAATDTPNCLHDACRLRLTPSPVFEGGQWPSTGLRGPWDSSRRVRIALYSHDTMGLGHARRNLLLAQAFANGGRPADILLITGNRETSAFSMPDGTDCLTIPSIHKAADGSYRARRLDMSLQELIVMRGNLIRAALESFQPDVFVVDNVPRGAARELDPVLQTLRQSGRTLCVLGLRDILDAPMVVDREWGAAGNFDAIRTHFDRIWVFGDREVYDPVAEYRFPADIASKVRYAGYLDQRARLSMDGVANNDSLADLNLPEGKLALCMVGGGQDGSRLAEAFAQAALPDGMNAVIVTGPFMPKETQVRLRGYVESSPRLRILEFVSEPGMLMQRADSVIAMGGYNTVCEVLSYNTRALIVPRVLPREEQLIRARRLSDLGVLDMLHPDCLSPERLSAWLTDTRNNSSGGTTINQNGVRHLPELLDELLTAPAVWAGNSDRMYGEESQYVSL